MFFVPRDNWRSLFFLKVFRYCEIFSTVIFSFSLKQVFWKKSVFYIISTVTVQSNTDVNVKFQSKAIVYYTHTDLKNVRSWLFYDNVFYNIFYGCSTIFFINHLWKHVELYCRTFVNRLLFKKVTFYIRWEQNYISKLHSMMTHNLMPWFKESTEKRKTSFLKETVENADLHKAVLSKTMTTQE